MTFGDSVTDLILINGRYCDRGFGIVFGFGRVGVGMDMGESMEAGAAVSHKP